MDDTEKQRLTKLLAGLAGKTVDEVQHRPGSNNLFVKFTDGTTLEVASWDYGEFRVDVYTEEG